MKKNSQVTKYIENVDEPMSSLMSEMREVIHEALPDAEEKIKRNMPVFCKDRDICYLQSCKGYVNFGLFHSSDIEDDKGILLGTGERMRHIKIKDKKDIRKTIFKKWLKELSKNS